MDFPGLAGDAGGSPGTSLQGEIERHEIERRADPGDAGDQMGPAQQQIEPVGNEGIERHMIVPRCQPEVASPATSKGELQLALYPEGCFEGRCAAASA